MDVCISSICRLPFYYELKIVFVLWLLSPTTKGSSILYRKLIHPQLARRESVRRQHFTIWNSETVLGNVMSARLKIVLFICFRFKLVRSLPVRMQFQIILAFFLQYAVAKSQTVPLARVGMLLSVNE